MDKRAKEKDYVVFYRSQEHYEILGFVRAKNIEEAKSKAAKLLKDEARKYFVGYAIIAEISTCSELQFDF